MFTIHDGLLTLINTCDVARIDVDDLSTLSTPLYYCYIYIYKNMYKIAVVGTVDKWISRKIPFSLIIACLLSHRLGSAAPPSKKVIHKLYSDS